MIRRILTTLQRRRRTRAKARADRALTARFVHAGAVVARFLPARCVAVGAPARVVATFDCPDDWKRA